MHNVSQSVPPTPKLGPTIIESHLVFNGKYYFAGLLSEVSYKRVLLKSAMKVIDDRQSLISDKKKVLVKEITQMVVKLTNTINARGKQLVMRLNEVNN